MNIVEELFKERAIYRQGILLLKKEDALEFVYACKKNKINILGIDGFFLCQDMIQPSMEDSVDFSSIKNMHDNYGLATQFIACKKKDLYFEIICE